MILSEVLAKLRTDKRLKQAQVARYVSSHTDKPITFRAVSYWETGISQPSIEQFFALCDLYEVKDINYTFRGIEDNYKNILKLNELGKSRVEEYISLLLSNSFFSYREYQYESNIIPNYIKLYDVSVAAGTGNFLDNDSYEDFEVDDTVPHETDFAVRVGGDSMMPRFVDEQVVFVKSQEWVDVGDIGIFSLNGDSYIKKLGIGELISLNPMYEPIKLTEMDSVYVYGKVLG